MSKWAKGSMGVPCRRSGGGFNGDPASPAPNNIVICNMKTGTEMKVGTILHKCSYMTRLCNVVY